MVDVVQLVEHRIVVPSVVGSSPIIHPKNLALTGQVFLWVDDGTLGGQGRLFLCPSPCPLPQGGAAADAAGAFGLATPKTWPFRPGFFLWVDDGTLGGQGRLFLCPTPCPLPQGGAAADAAGAFGLATPKTWPFPARFFGGWMMGPGGRSVRTASCSQGGGGGGCGGCFPSRLLSRQRK